jgi:hypothetical protein
MDAATMAQPKAKTQTASKAAPKPTALTIKGNPDWREWVDQGASFCRTDVAKLVDAALVDYLKAKGFTKLPPER